MMEKLRPKSDRAPRDHKYNSSQMKTPDINIDILLLD